MKIYEGNLAKRNFSYLGNSNYSYFCVFPYRLSFFYDYFGQSAQLELQPAAQNNVIANKTANWEKYKNEEYGYEIKYPNNCSIISMKASELPPFYASNGVDRKHAIYLNNCNTVVEVYTNDNNLSINDWLDYFTSNMFPVKKELNNKTLVTVSNESAIKGLFENSFKITAFYKDNYVYIIESSEVDLSMNKEEEQIWLSDNWQNSDDSYVKILLTFKINK